MARRLGELKGKGYARDSLTIDISKIHVKQEPANQENLLPFTYDDEDCLERELSEIYSSYEFAEFSHGRELFEKDLVAETGTTQWSTLSDDVQRQFITSQLDMLETVVSPKKHEETLRILQYISQGVTADLDDAKAPLLVLLQTSNYLLLESCAIPMLVQGLSRVARSAIAINGMKPERADLCMSLYLNIIFNIIVLNQTDADFAKELESTKYNKSTLASILVDMIGEFNDRQDCSYPIKKILLVLWKVLSITLGSMTTLKRKKDISLATAGWFKLGNTEISTKSRAAHIDQFTRFAERYQNDILLTRFYDIPMMFDDEPTTTTNNTNYYANSNVNTVKRKNSMRLPPALGEALSIMTKNLYPPASPMPTPPASPPSSPPQSPPATFQRHRFGRAPQHHTPLQNIPHSKQQHATQPPTTEQQQPQQQPQKPQKPRAMVHPTLQTPFERLYCELLPKINTTLIILLKILLAAAPTVKGYAGTTNLTIEAGNEAMDGAPPGRHREIVLKAGAAILLLIMKHAKLNSPMQWAHIRKVLVDAKCVLLMLKLVNHDLNVHLTSPADPPSCLLFTPNESCCWRNFFSMTTVLRILQKITKQHLPAIRILLQYKAPTILRKVNETHHPLMRMYSLKIMKSMVPYLSRKWRVSNMKVISEIYSRVRLETRDEWLSNDLSDTYMTIRPEETLATAQIDDFIRNQYYEWWDNQSKMRSATDLIYTPECLLGLDPVAAQMAQEPLDEEFKRNWESWVTWEETGRNWATFM